MSKDDQPKQDPPSAGMTDALKLLAIIVGCMLLAWGLMRGLSYFF